MRAAGKAGRMAAMKGRERTTLANKYVVRSRLFMAGSPPRGTASSALGSRCT